MDIEIILVEGAKQKYLNSPRAKWDKEEIDKLGVPERTKILMWNSFVNYQSSLLRKAKIENLDIESLKFYHDYVNIYLTRRDVFYNKMGMHTRHKQIVNRIKLLIFEELEKKGAIKW